MYAYFFIPDFLPEDDHMPFVHEGLTRVLYLIPDRFPPVWHTADDDKEHLDMGTIQVAEMHMFFLGDHWILLQLTRPFFSLRC